MILMISLDNKSNGFVKTSFPILDIRDRNAIIFASKLRYSDDPMIYNFCDMLYKDMLAMLNGKVVPVLDYGLLRSYHDPNSECYFWVMISG